MTVGARITFGDDRFCSSCRGTGDVNGHPCARCDGIGIVSKHRPVARRTDPETSWAAARSIPADQLRESQRAVLAMLRRFGPMTDEGIAEALAGTQYVISPSGARTRRSELVAAGYVRDSGKRVRLPSGRQSIVWEAVRAAP